MMLPDCGSSVEIEQKGEYLWVRPLEDFDVNIVNLLSKNLNESIGDDASLPLIIDFSKVTYINSAAIGSLALLVKMYRDKKLDLLFVNPSPFVKDIFKQTGMTKVVSLYATEKDLPEKTLSGKK